MRISELIRELTEVRQQEGDLEIMQKSAIYSQLVNYSPELEVVEAANIPSGTCFEAEAFDKDEHRVNQRKVLLF